MKAGALNLASPEVKIHLDSSESSDPIDVEQKEMRETNSLVEEFMLLANISVAKKIQETFPLTSVLRCVMPLFTGEGLLKTAFYLQTPSASASNELRKAAGYIEKTQRTDA